MLWVVIFRFSDSSQTDRVLQEQRNSFLFFEVLKLKVS